MIEFFNTFSDFVFSSIKYFLSSYFGFLVGGLILVASLFALVFKMASRRY